MDANEEQALIDAVARRVRAELAASDLTAKDLAAALGLDRVTVSRYLNGHRDIPMRTFLRIADILGTEGGRILDDAMRRAASGDDL